MPSLTLSDGIVNERKTSQTGYVHSTVFDANRVNSHLLRYELDAVLTGAEILDVTQLRHSRRTCDRRLHVVMVSTYHTRSAAMTVATDREMIHWNFSNETVRFNSPTRVSEP